VMTLRPAPHLGKLNRSGYSEHWPSPVRLSARADLPLAEPFPNSGPDERQEPDGKTTPPRAYATSRSSGSSRS
jgi:hypothetical protein